MAAPTEYIRGTSFTDAQAADPVSPLSGPGIDAEFDRLKITVDSIIAAMAQIQRADGALANGSVGADQIDEAIYTGLRAAVPWSVDTQYAINDSALYTSGSVVWLVRCVSPHRSGDFDVDFAAGVWAFLADFTPPSVVGIVPVVSGGTGANTPAGARAALGLGDLAEFDVAGVDVGGTGATTAAGARTGLGLEIGTHVQAFSAALTSLAGLTLAADKMPYATGPNAFALADLTAFVRTLLASADAAAARGTLAAMKGNQTTVTDWNDALKDGHYYAAGTAANAPTANAFVGTVLRFDDNNIVQVLFRFDTKAGFVRYRAAGTFSAWSALDIAGGPKSLVYADVTASRAANVDYTNNTGRPKAVTIIITYTSINTITQFQIDGGPYSSFAIGNNLSGLTFSHSVIVPPGSTYRLQRTTGTITINQWQEGTL